MQREELRTLDKQSANELTVHTVEVQPLTKAQLNGKASSFADFMVPQTKEFETRLLKSGGSQAKKPAVTYDEASARKTHNDLYEKVQKGHITTT